MVMLMFRRLCAQPVPRRLLTSQPIQFLCNATPEEDRLQWLASLSKDELECAFDRMTDTGQQQMYREALRELGGGDLIPVEPPSAHLPTVRWVITPNEHSRKFFPGCNVSDTPQQFRSPAEAVSSPLATQLLLIPGVSRLLFGPDFITVTKDSSVTWHAIGKQASDTIAIFAPMLQSSMPMMPDMPSSTAEESETVLTIKEALEELIRPTLLEDGGDVQFVEFNEQTRVLVVELKGSCDGCPSSSNDTLKSQIFSVVSLYVEDVSEVEFLKQGEERKRDRFAESMRVLTSQGLNDSEVVDDPDKWMER